MNGRFLYCRIKVDLESQVDAAPTSIEPEKEEREEPYFDSLEDPVNYWDDSWYFCVVLVHCRKTRLEQRKQRFFENMGEYLSILV